MTINRHITLAKLVFAATALLFAVVAMQSCSGGSGSKAGAQDTIRLLATPDAGNFVPHPAGVPFTKVEIDLGRQLFYSPALSKNGKVSCATCHNPALSFTDGLALGTNGVTGKPLPRSAPAIINLAWADSLFWDGRAKGLEAQALGPLTAHDEMGLSEAEVPEKAKLAVKNLAEYMEAIYGDEQVTTQRVLRAIAQYERSLVSTTSEYDKFRTRQPGYRTMAPNVGNGFMVFNINCGNCHAGDHFTDGKFHNVGLDPWPALDSKLPTLARFTVTNSLADVGSYKTPTLRNIALTAPYMHDGRFQTLEQVVKFYVNDVHDNPNLARQMRNNDGKPGLNISEQDQADLIAFLNTLTDRQFVREHAGDATKPPLLKP